jgi:5-oxoprolinase (ATP-hydrolysing) subunit C
VREALLVERSGFATVQDLGRTGHTSSGISGGGAADGWSARTANVLVGNRPGAALVEATGSTLTVVARSRMLLAVTGAAEEVVVDGTRHRSWQPLVVGTGQRVVLPAPRTGLRSYLAVNGVLDAERTLGSVAPDALLGLGRRLAAGDVLRVESRFEELDHPHFRLPLFRLGATRPRMGDRWVVDVTAGPEADDFESAITQVAEPFPVSPHSDHVGLRLAGEVPRRRVSHEILSRGVPVGAIEIPPGGGLLVLLRARLVTAGYPVVAVATTAAVDLLGQVGPGDRVTFRAREVADAVTELRRRERELIALAERTATVLRHVGLGQLITPSDTARTRADRPRQTRRGRTT